MLACYGRGTTITVKSARSCYNGEKRPLLPPSRCSALVSHHCIIVRYGDIPDADVIGHDDEDVGRTLPVGCTIAQTFLRATPLNARQSSRKGAAERSSCHGHPDATQGRYLRQEPQ
jgi:hypothetical protein